MADKESRPGSRASQGSVADVVSEVTIRALQEFDSGVMEPADQGEHPFKNNGEVEVEGEVTAAETQNKSRPHSATENEIEGSRPASAKPSSRTPSRSSRPESARPESARPGSARPGSEMQESARPGSERPGSARPGSARPGSARPTSAHPSRSGSGASKRSVAERLSSSTGLERAGQPTEEQETAAQSTDLRKSTPPAEIEGSIVNSVHDDGLPSRGTATLTATAYTGVAPPPTQALGTQQEDIHPANNATQLNPHLVEEDYAGSVSGADVEEEEDASNDEEETDLVVLDPEHPLMRRFQGALNKQLSKQLEKVRLEHSELSEALKRKLAERENMGVELYGAQQELARYQVLLEQNHDQYNHVKHSRDVKEQGLAAVRSQYKQMQLEQNEEKKKAAQLQQEVENLALRLFYVNNAKEDVRSDISVMKRAAERADVEVAQAEANKQKQDLYVDRLVESVDKLQEDIAITEAQITAQLEETKAAKASLAEASMEIENIQLEKKQLYTQWNSSLIGMKRRDEAFAAMQEANDQQRQRIKSLETEIEGYRKQIAKEEEHNEKLTLVLNKCEVDIATSKKLLDICNRKMDALKTEYSTYTRMLYETEEALNRAGLEKVQRGHEMNSLRKQIEKEYLEKVRLEDEIMDVVRNQLTFDKAAQYTDRMTRKCRQLTKDLEAQIAQVENEIATDSLNNVTTRATIGNLKKSLEELETIIGQKNDIINKSENESIKRNAVIERKQQVIDQFNKKLEQMISQAGGVELGPLEITINSLTKSIESMQQDIAHLQLLWLREQGELVRLSKESDQSHEDVNLLKKKISILSQKKIRIENAIDKENAETQDIEKNIRDLRNDMIRLNQMLHHETGAYESLEKDNILTENDFIGKLKEAELNSIQIQAKLDSLKEEKERLLNSLVESERQIMLWEKKTQLARETRAAVDSEIGQGEISAMKSEIHRMEVRYSQLMRQQEKMIQDMEKAVSRRDTIVTRGDAQAKIAARSRQKDKAVTKGTFQRQMAELRKKIKSSIRDAQGCDAELHALRVDQQNLGQLLEAKQLGCRELESNADILDGDIERQLETKHRNMADLVAKQQKTKYYQQIKDRKYKRVVRDDSLLDTEREKQIDKMQSLNNIVERLQDEFPQMQPALRKVSLSLGSRIMEEEQSSARGSEILAP